MARPLAIFTVVAGLLFLLLGISTRRWHAAAFLVTLALLAVTALEFVTVGAAWLFLSWRVSRRGGSWGVSPMLTRPLNVFALAWFGIALASAVSVSVPPTDAATADVEVRGGRNVYLILLDGYPRHDSLMEDFGFDNRSFLEDLRRRGFDVAEASGSLYPSSIQTIASMFQNRPLEQLLDEDWTGDHDQHRRLWHALNTSPIADAYSELGYTTYSIVPPAPGHDWRQADVVYDSPWLSDFEGYLIRGGILRLIIPWYAMNRAEILDAFDYLEATAGTTPRFVWAHILSPHAPYVFAADGGPALPCGTPCANHAGPPNPTLGNRLTGQLTFLNARVLKALDHIIQVDPGAIIVVFSDHGVRRDRNNMDEWFRTLLAIRGTGVADDAKTSELMGLVGSAGLSRPVPR